MISAEVINTIVTAVLVGVCCWFSYMIGHLRGYDQGFARRDELEKELDSIYKRR